MGGPVCFRGPPETSPTPRPPGSAVPAPASRLRSALASLLPLHVPLDRISGSQVTPAQSRTCHLPLNPHPPHVFHLSDLREGWQSSVILLIKPQPSLGCSAHHWPNDVNSLPLILQRLLLVSASQPYLRPDLERSPSLPPPNPEDDVTYELSTLQPPGDHHNPSQLTVLFYLQLVLATWESTD